MHLEMTALILANADGGTFETRLTHLGAVHILATVAHKLGILALRRWYVVNCVGYWMETGDKTVEHLEMAAVKEGNRTLVEEDIDWCVS